MAESLAEPLMAVVLVNLYVPVSALVTVLLELELVLGFVVLAALLILT
nr:MULTISPECIES: hypothetical protein [Lactiplantibacillus]